MTARTGLQEPTESWHTSRKLYVKILFRGLNTVACLSYCTYSAPALTYLIFANQGYDADEDLSKEELSKSVAYSALVDDSLTDALVGLS